jgi:hypothetical protein
MVLPKGKGCSMSKIDEILEHASKGTLHRLILDTYERGHDGEDAAFVADAVDLHNNGAIDLLASLSPMALEASKGFHFFTLQQFYCEPPRDCRRPVSSNYAAIGVSSSMA